jgi:hypothetical protein
MSRFKSVEQICRKWQRRYAAEGYGCPIPKKNEPADPINQRVRVFKAHPQGEPEMNTRRDAQ